jgi:hypothetical protein
MKRFHLPAILLSFLLVSCGGVSANAQSGEPAFLVVTKNPDDQVSIQHQNETTLIDIQSPTGIGTASFELESGVMPGAVVLHLHLQGLEGFRLTSAEQSISASVASSDVSSIDQQLISSGDEVPLQPGHPLWMNIETVSERLQKTIPLEQGYFQISLPREFLQKAGQAFAIEWIDFYR